MVMIFSVLDIGWSDRHECDSMPLGTVVGVKWDSNEGMSWCLYDKSHTEPPPTITHCPFCGEKLPEVVLMPPDPSDEQVRKWRKQTKRMAKKVMRWLRETQGGKHD